MTARFSIPIWGLVAITFVASGCAATHSAVQIGKANKVVQRAKDRGAEDHAVYEFTMAQNYLRKAREEANHSDFKDSIALSRGAAEWADKAIIVIEKEGRGLDPDSLPGETRILTDEDRKTDDASNLPPEDDDLPEKSNDDTELEETPEDKGTAEDSQPPTEDDPKAPAEDDPKAPAEDMPKAPAEVPQ